MKFIKIFTVGLLASLGAIFTVGLLASLGVDAAIGAVNRSIVIADLDGVLLASISTGKRCGPVDYHTPDGSVSITIAANKCVNLYVR